MLADCVTTTPKSDVRCTVVVTLLELLAPLESITDVEEIVAVFCLVLSCAEPAASAVLGKLPVIAIVPVLPFVRDSPVQPVAVQPEAVRLPPRTTPVGTNPLGKVLTMLTPVASLGPKLFTVNV